MKRNSFPFLLALLMSMVANIALAYDVEIDGIYYDLSETEATVTYKDMNGNFYSGTVVIPESITYNSKTYRITGIGSYAFLNCSALTSVNIPSSVTDICNGAFLGCSALTSITIPNSVEKIGYEAFLGTAWYENQPDGLVYAGKVVYKYKGTMPENTIIDIKDGTLSIVREAFSGCVGLSSIIIPESVTEIGDRAFDGCNGLLSIKVKDGNPVYDSRNDCNALIETVSNTLIKGCRNSVIPEGITSISDYAFRACVGLASITIPNSVTSIGNSAFIACGDLTSITIPGSVTSIGDMAFKWCRGLNSITISDGVKSIGEQAFQDCTSLTTINIPNSVSNIGKEAFDRTAWYDNKPRGVVYAGKVSYKYKGTMPSNTKINIKDGTLSISREAFVYCTNLVSVNIPNSVTSIGIDAFWGCTGITSIDIPEGVTSIGASAFSSCSGLTTIKIPESVTEIGKSAFDTRSSAVSSIKVGMKTPISISEDTFLSSYECATLYVPLGCRAAYQAADVWKNFRSIVECDLVSIEDQIIVAGQSKTLEINVNTKSYTNLVGFQMDLTLPEGVGIDKAGCSLSSRITDENQELVIGKLENGDYRITSTSLSLTPISGNEGTLLTLKLTAEEGCVGGKATISNIIFSTSESEKIIMTDETFDIGILYKLIYKVDDEVYKTAEFAYNTVPVLIDDKPTKEGYTFSGWSELPGTMPNHDVTITGSFSANSYKLTYIVNGEVYKTESVVYGTTIVPEAGLTKEGYTFSGWSEIPATMPAKDVVVTGSFTVNNYTLTYKVDGTEYKKLTVEYGTSIIPEGAPTKEGYTFSGWSEIPRTMPAKDVVVTGSFTVNNYTLTYKVDGEEYKTSTIVYGTAITPEVEPTKEGYTFSGWSWIPQKMPAEDVTVTGTFTVNNYTLTYMLEGKEYKTLTVAYGTVLTPEAAPTKEGYTFSGWSEIPETMPAKDVVVTGSYSINSYTLIYKVDGEEYKTSTIVYGTAIKPEAEPTKEGYTFSGWSWIPQKMPAEDVVVTGTFTVNSYTVTFMDGDKVLYTEEVNYGETIPIPEIKDKYGLVYKWLDVPETMPAHDVVILVDETDIIDGPTPDPSLVERESIYDLSGRKLLALQKGINIIRMNDGTSRKVMVK